jgi:hypothetical protein
MGLDISCECGDINFRAGSYSGFHEWRVALAKISGTTLGKMRGFNGDIEWTKTEPFCELLNHSDCDGELTSQECSNLLVDFNYWAQTINTYWANPEQRYDKERFDDWHEAIKHCIYKNEKLVFG